LVCGLDDEKLTKNQEGLQLDSDEPVLDTSSDERSKNKLEKTVYTGYYSVLSKDKTKTIVSL
jgi:hypothetical protein